MFLNMRKHFLELIFLFFSSFTCFAQDYPTKPITLQVPFAPGGATDIIARIISEPLGKVLGNNVIVENIAGGGGIIGATATVRAKPDGYSLGMATVSTTAANPAINPNSPYNPILDFTPIINIAATPNIIVVHPSFPAKNYNDLLMELKRNPGKYSYSSAGMGSYGHLLTELWKSVAGVYVTHIPYRGAGPALNDLVSGQVAIMFDGLPSSLPFIQQGRLVPIVIASPQRSSQLPNIPTFKEIGLDPVNRMAYYGILGPKNLPREVIDKINLGVKKALQDPVTRRRVENIGAVIVENSSDEFSLQIKDEYETLKKIISEKKIKFD